MSDRLLLSSCWLIYLVAIATSGGFVTYLAGWQHPLAWTGVGVFAALVAVAWWGRAPQASTPRFSGFDILMQTAVHCLPVLLLAGIGNQALGRHAAQLAPQTVRAGPAPAASDELTLSDLYRRHAVLPAETTLIGMTFVPTDADCARLPGGLTRADVPLLLYRYEITCCAADAAPVFVILHGLDPAAYRDDTWLRVTGKLTPPGGPTNLARLEVEAATGVPPPASSYLSRRFDGR